MIRANHMKIFLSAALLLAFTASGYAYSYDTSYSSVPSDSSTTLSGDVQLTQKNDKITLSLRDSDVKQVLRMFADKAGKNIVFHESVKGKVTLDLVDMPINDAFALVLQIAGLNYYNQNNTLIILAKSASDNAVFSKQEMMTFPIQYVSATKIADFLNRNVFGAKKAGLSGVDAATVNAATNELIVFGMPSDAPIVKKVIAQFDRKPASKTFAVSHTTPAEMANIVCNMLFPAQGIQMNGGGNEVSGEEFRAPGMGTGGAAGIVTGGAAETTTGDIKLGEGIIACSVAGNSANGFDIQNLSISYFPQRGTIMMMGGSAAQQKMVEEFIRANDVKQPQAYVEMSIVELNEQGMKELSNEWRFQSGFFNFNFDGTSSKASASKKGWWVDPETGIRSFRNPGTDDIAKRSHYLSWAMNYLIQNSKGRVLANPKIIVTNGQTSIIDLTEDYVEKVTSEYLTSSLVGEGTAGQVQKQYEIGDDKGLKIELTPFISPDGYVTMNIKPEYATEAGKLYSDEGEQDKDLAATLLNRRNLELKNVRVKDGETLVIGGLIQEVDQKQVNKIPVLGDLPLIGAAFRSTNTTKAKSELVIMITPRIINDGEGAVADSL